MDSEPKTAKPASQSRAGSTVSEVGFLLSWIVSDPLRPSMLRALPAVGGLFFAAFLQGFAFAFAVGYLSLSTTNWELDGEQVAANLPGWAIGLLPFSTDFVWDLSPSTSIVSIVIGLFVAIFIFQALLSAASMSSLIDLGYKYHSKAARRLFMQYKDQIRQGTERIAAGASVDTRLLASMANSESRYLGRGLTTLYVGVNSLITLTLGLVLISRTEPLVLVGGFVFILLAILLQMRVMAFGLRASRDLVEMSGPNNAQLASIVQSITISPAAFSVNRDDIDALMTDDGPVRDYDLAYQRRLKIGVLSTLLNNLAFIIALVILLIYLIGGVGDGSLSPASAFASIVIYRFIFGGAAGLLGAIVSFVSFKPYFDNYISYVSHKPPDAARGARQEIVTDDFVFIGANGSRIPIFDGEWLAVAVNKGTFSWLMAVNVFDKCLSDTTWAKLDIPRDVVLVSNFYPLLRGGVRHSTGLPEEVNWDATRRTLAPFSADIDEIEKIVRGGYADLDAEEAWALFTPRLFTLLGLVNAISRRAKVIYANESALRSIPERERAVLADCLQDFRLIVHYESLPTFSMKPYPIRFMLVSEEGAFAEVNPARVEEVDEQTRAAFLKSGFKTASSFIEEEL